MSRSEGREVEEEQERRKWRRERGSRRSHRTPDAHKDAARNTLAYYRYIRGLLQVGRAGEKGTWRVSFLLPLSNFMLLIFVSSEIWLFLFNCRLLRFLFYRCSGLFTILLFCFTLFALNCAAFLWLFTYNYLFNFFCLTHVFFIFLLARQAVESFMSQPSPAHTHSNTMSFFPLLIFLLLWYGSEKPPLTDDDVSTDGNLAQHWITLGISSALCQRRCLRRRRCPPNRLC